MNTFELRKLIDKDHHSVREVYQDAIQSQGHILYTPEQIDAWSAMAWLPGVLDRSLNEGQGWVSCHKQNIEAFAVRYPSDRLALLYCRGRSARSGHATALLDVVEQQARKEGQIKLVAEASLLSFSLLLRCGWVIKFPENIKIGGVLFQRYLMEKQLL
tara:strand:- start:262 stop:735 length:474 start_codon:yes stop_codon:yes gene_type:complete